MHETNSSATRAPEHCPDNAAPSITEEHHMSCAYTRTLNTTSRRMFFFPYSLLLMLSDPKVSPGVASQAEEQRRQFLGNHSRSGRCFGRSRSGILHLRGMCLKSNKPQQMTVSGSVAHPHQQSPPHSIAVFSQQGCEPHVGYSFLIFPLYSVHCPRFGKALPTPCTQKHLTDA